MGFSETAGTQIWTTTTPEIDNHMYGVNRRSLSRHPLQRRLNRKRRKHIRIRRKTGALSWILLSPSYGLLGLLGQCSNAIKAFATGNLFWYGSEHSPAAVLEPGFMIGALNAKTGAPIWNINFWDGGGNWQAWQ